MTTRTDCHRPSVINAEDYAFVGVEYMKTDIEVGDAAALRREQEIIAAHMKATGGTYSDHQHGGSCHVCGAHAIYTVLFHHVPTNTYIRTGMDCAGHLEAQATDRFRRVKEGVKAAREAKAGRAKAQAVLTDAGLSRAWEISNATDEQLESLGALTRREYADGHWLESTWELRTLNDIVGKLVRYGSLSEKQSSFLRTLAEKIDSKKERDERIAAEREAEKANAEDVPEGRVTIRGEVVTVKEQESMYGVQLKMLVKDDRGFKVWGTCPSSISDVDRGSRVQFDAKVKPSDDDAKFGFYSRPTKASVLEAAAV